MEVKITKEFLNSRIEKIMRSGALSQKGQGKENESVDGNTVESDEKAVQEIESIIAGMEAVEDEFFSEMTFSDYLKTIESFCSMSQGLMVFAMTGEMFNMMDSDGVPRPNTEDIIGQDGLNRAKLMIACEKAVFIMLEKTREAQNKKLKKFLEG